MQHIIDAIEYSLDTQNAYGALALALTVPDICGWLETPIVSSRARFTRWFDRYVSHHYVHEIGAWRTKTIFLTGDDCYALRCAYLHSGQDDITMQRAQKALDSFVFVVTAPGSTMHCNRFNNVLQLQLDIFCRQISDGAKQFCIDFASDALVQSRMATMLTIKDARQGFTI